MDSNQGYVTSWAGFLDYHGGYHKLSGFAIAMGVCIWVGTGGSIIPQIIKLIKIRSSLGISPIFGRQI